MSDYPYPCTHCGMCCIVEVCPAGRMILGISEQGPCPALIENSCDLYRVAASMMPRKAFEKRMGFGTGCCIKARAVSTIGTEIDFAGLPPDIKAELARKARTQGALIAPKGFGLSPEYSPGPDSQDSSEDTEACVGAIVGTKKGEA